MNPRLRVLVFLSFAGLLAAAQADTAKPDAASGDWPCWRGPGRTGVSSEKGLLKQWPEDGPKLAWKIAGLGEGYGSPSVSGGKIFILAAAKGTEQLVALNAADGKRLWAGDIGPAAKVSYPGVRSTPAVDGELAYALSSNGMLACFKVADGSKVWSRDLRKDFDGKTGIWAYAESPLIDGDRVICTPGGESATMVGLDKKTGKEVWRSAVTGLKMKERTGGFGGFGGKGGKGGKGGFGRAQTYNTAGYASAVAAEVGSVKQYVQFLAGGVVGVSASDGKLLWHYDGPSSGMANCVTPVVRDDSVFAAASYRTGAGRAKITKTSEGFKAEELYFVNNMATFHGGLVLVGDHIYGTNDSGLVCVDFKTGKVAWTNRSVGKGAVIAADGHIILRGERGRVALVEANPEAYKEKGVFTPAGTKEAAERPAGGFGGGFGRGGNSAWAHPVVAGGKLYLRDGDRLLCYDIKDAK